MFGFCGGVKNPETSNSLFNVFNFVQFMFKTRFIKKFRVLRIMKDHAFVLALKFKSLTLPVVLCK